MFRLTLMLSLLACTAAAAQPTIDIVYLGGGKFDVMVSNLDPEGAWVSGGLLGPGAQFVYSADPNSLVDASLGRAAMVGITAASVAAAVGLMALWLMFAGVLRVRWMQPDRDR